MLRALSDITPTVKSFRCYQNYLTNLKSNFSYVIRPLNRITQVAEAVSTGDMEAEFEQQSNDEVGSLTKAFTRMKRSLAIALKNLEK